MPPQAYVRPTGQAYTGNIGALIPCQAPGVGPQRGDENDVIRLTWLQGRIAAGLGRPLEARRRLAQARRACEQRGKRGSGAGFTAAGLAACIAVHNVPRANPRPA